MVLTKLFGSKKNKKTQTQPSPTKPASPPVDPGPKTLDELVSLSRSDDRKDHLTALSELARRLTAGESPLDEMVAQGLNKTDRVALELHLDESARPSDVGEEDWVKVAIKGFSASVRKTAAEQISSEPSLEVLIKSSKGRDKAVYRIAKDKLDVIRQSQREAQEQEEKARTVVDAMERHANASLDPLYANKLKSLIDQWQSWQDLASEPLRQRFDQARQTAEARVQELEQAAQAEEEHHQALAMADQNRQAIAERVLNELRERIDALSLSEDDVREAQLFLTEQQHAWRESEQLSRPSKDEERAFHRLCTAFEAVLAKQASIEKRFGGWEALLQRLEHSPDEMDAEAHALDEWLHDLDWPDDTPPPELKARVEQVLAAHHDQLEEHRKKEVHAVRQARGLMRRCMAAVNEGHLKRASGLLHGVQDALEGLTEPRHPGLFRQFEETREAVEKLRDWQSFAVQPKKEALIERMRQMVDQSMEPQARARAIRVMQDEWRMLSRGLQNQHQDLWEQFHELAQQAYEPCREYFNEQSKLRGLNLEKRRELVQQLEQYEAITDWENPDIKELDRVMNMARQDWRRFSPVDRAANKDVQKAFDEVYQRIRGRLQQEQSEFREAKLAIIERARALLDEEDVRHATETAKQLQKEWQQAGHLARRDEQALWKDFRAVCDELFERRGQQIEAFKADLEEHRIEAERLIGQIEALARLDDVLAEQEQYQSLREAFKHLGTLPKAHHKELMDRYTKACKAFEAASRAQRSRQKDQNWLDLIDWVRRARFDEAADLDALRDDFERMDVPALARDLADRLNSWRLPPQPEDAEELRRRTIELEALADLETPEADRALRMELQVKRLQEGLGRSTSPTDFDQAVVDWLATGSVAQADYEPLAERMKAAREAWVARKN